MRLSAGLLRKRPACSRRPTPTTSASLEVIATDDWILWGRGIGGHPHTGTPANRPPGSARRRHRRRRGAGRRSASLCVQAPRCGARCSTGSRSCSGERPDGERGRNSRSGSVGRACTGRRTAGTPVCEAGPIKGRTLPASSAAVCSRGPACICRRALDAAQRRAAPQTAACSRRPTPTTSASLEVIATDDWILWGRGIGGHPHTGTPANRPPGDIDGDAVPGDGRPVCVSKLHATGLVARRARGRARESDPTANGGGTAGADLSVGPVLVGGQPVRLYVRQAGPIKGRTLPASSAAVCSRGPACICRRALDAAQRRLLRKRPPAPEGRHQQQAQAWRSSRPTTGSCGGVGLEGIRTRGLPRTGRPERSPQTSTATLCRGDGRPVCVSKLHATGLVARRARGRARESDPAANGGGTAGADLSVGLYWSADSRYACM